MLARSDEQHCIICLQIQPMADTSIAQWLQEPCLICHLIDLAHDVHNQDEEHGRNRVSLSESSGVLDRRARAAVDENSCAGGRQDQGHQVNPLLAETMHAQHSQAEGPAH